MGMNNDCIVRTTSLHSILPLVPVITEDSKKKWRHELVYWQGSVV